jgi:hypothetical protein
MEMIQMTEPLVLPEPKTKPKPRRDSPKPKPRKDDPWTVPAPKKNPTPKAIKITVMNKKNTNGKMVIKTISEFDLMKSMMTKEAFYKKFTLSNDLVTKIAARDAMANVAFTDVSPVYLSQEGRRSAQCN